MCFCYGVKEGSVYLCVMFELFYDFVLIIGVGVVIVVIVIEDLFNSVEIWVFYRMFDIIYSCSLYLWFIYWFRSDKFIVFNYFLF